LRLCEGADLAAGPARDKFLRSVKANYLDRSTGLFCTDVDADGTRQIQGPRGISTLYGLHFLRDVSSEFAADQYHRAHQQIVREVLGLAAVREFPVGVDAEGDIDSGALMFGLGPSASGFAIAAAAVMGDEATARALLKAAALAGLPEMQSGELRYMTMPPVGQAVILFGKTELLLTMTRRGNGK
jgi:hypothetical protein